MIKNFDQKLKEADGSDYLEVKASGAFNAEGKALFEVDAAGAAVLHPVKIGSIIGNLLKNSTGGKELSGDEYIARWNLMQRISKGDVELSSDGKETDVIRDLVVKSGMSPFIIGQICVFLNEKNI